VNLHHSLKEDVLYFLFLNNIVI